MDNVAFYFNTSEWNEEEAEQDWTDFAANDRGYIDFAYSSCNFNHEIYFDDMDSEILSAAIQSFQEPVSFDGGLERSQKPLATENSYLPKTNEKVLSSLHLLNIHRTEPAMRRNKPYQASNKVANCRQLSTEDVMRIAGARYIQHSVPNDGDLSTLAHPLSSMHLGLADEEVQSVELIHLLLSSAEKIDHRQYEQASKMLTQCGNLSSSNGSSIQRVVYYFVEALQERIDREIGKLSLKVLEMKLRWEDIEVSLMGPHPALLAFQQMLPFSRVIQFTAMQAIIESVASARMIHLIDLCIRLGWHWIILMQALASRVSCPVKSLKISAVGTSKEKIEETGRHLVSFAESLNLPFTFNTVIVSDMNDLDEDRFGLEVGEVVGVHAPTTLRTMIFEPNSLEKLIKVIRNLNPCVMTVTEIEANHNSTSFINRFIEALFYFGAWFDCIGESMAGDDRNRTFIEANFMHQAIRSIIVTEGSERKVRHVKINMWRSFFERFGFVEVDQSQLALYQAGLIVEQFKCGSCCTIDMNGKGLTVGWKGTPLFSFSAWRLQW